MRKVVPIAVMVAALTASFHAKTPPATGAQAAKIEAGKVVYDAQKCRTCHMIGGVGSKASTALDDVGSKLSEADIRMWLTDPDAMTAKLKTKPKVKMKKVVLKDPDLENLVAYMLSLKK